MVVVASKLELFSFGLFCYLNCLLDAFFVRLLSVE